MRAWLISAVLLAASALGETAAAEPLHAGSELDFPPFAMTDGAGTAEGFSVEILRAVAAKLDRPLTIKVAPWSTVREDLEKGRLDLLPFMSYSTERAARVDFTTPYVRLQDAIFVREGTDEIESLDDLETQRTIVMAGDFAHDYLKERWPDKGLILAKTMSEAFRFLSAGYGDAVVASAIAGYWTIRELALENIVMAGEPVGEYVREFAFAVRKGDHALRQEIDMALAELQASGRITEVYKRWFDSLDPERIAMRRRVERLGWGVAILVVLAGFAMLWTTSLRREVARQTRALRAQDEVILEQKASLAAASKLSSLGEMASGVAHEINNPLAIIDGRARLIERALVAGRGDDPALLEHVRSLRQTVERIARIVRGLRAFARDADEDPFAESSVAEILEMTVALCQERMRINGIELRLPEVPPDLVIACRATQISQILVNLLNNAFDAVEEARTRWIALRIRDEGETIVLEVEDSGDGVPEALRDRIFQPFFTTKPIGKGSGLGLSISRGLAESHGGRLELGKGSLMRLTLPKRQDPAVDEAA